MHEGAFFGQVAFILCPEDFVLVARIYWVVGSMEVAIRLDKKTNGGPAHFENQVVSVCCVCGDWFLSDHQASEEFCGLWSVRNRFMRVCSMTVLVASTSGSVEFSLL